MTDVDYDVVVLGAGPVGLAVAAALGGEGLGVALLERGALAAYDGPQRRRLGPACLCAQSR